jgi:hypothetical protein
VKRFQHNGTGNGAHNGITVEVVGVTLFWLVTARCLDNGVGSVVGNFRTALKHLLECRELEPGDLLVYLAFDGLFIVGHENLEKGPYVAAVRFEFFSNADRKGVVLRVELKPVYNEVRSMSRVEKERIKYRHFIDFFIIWRVEHKHYRHKPLLGPSDVFSMRSSDAE